MTERESPFIDRTGKSLERPQDQWPPYVIPKEAIDLEIERLADLPAPNNGRRESFIAHPRAKEPGLGLAPGIRVSLSVLKPGERTKSFRHTATEVNFCIQGGGYTEVGGKRIDFKQYDVWNHPSYHVYSHVNDTDELQVRLCYSDAALLEMMGIYIADEDPPSVKEEERDYADEKNRTDPRAKNPFGTFQLTDDGAWLMPYETLINPETVESKAHHWPWEQVKEHLDKLSALGKDYVGRRLYLLYNPMTGRTNGTTPNFFATMTCRPEGIVDRPHRHTSAAMNYYFSGRGQSTVEGEIVEWKAGDLMLSAPGWAIHNHAAKEGTVYELTIQDQPLNIAMESLLWQEDLKLPAAILGSEAGFGTNR
ncbi:MAG: gentisate 1,2-dioxygenase [Proteobacteria bacterium]|nr:gentisate 1,2-dioxygenase [Pseudomonadota bacterium]